MPFKFPVPPLLSPFHTSDALCLPPLSKMHTWPPFICLFVCVSADALCSAAPVLWHPFRLLLSLLLPCPTPWWLFNEPKAASLPKRTVYIDKELFCVCFLEYIVKFHNKCIFSLFSRYLVFSSILSSSAPSRLAFTFLSVIPFSPGIYIVNPIMCVKSFSVHSVK